MKKRVLAALMSLVLAFSVAACNAEDVAVQQPQSEAESESPSEEETVSEEPAEETADNMIANGDFSEGVGTWMTYLEGGEGSLNVNADGQLVVDITNVGDLDYSVQAYYDGIVLDQGVVYKFAFDVAASVPRTVVWRIQLNGGDYSAYFTEEIAATTQMQHVEYEFTMDKPSDPAPRLCFNLGVYEADGELGPHTVMLDNFEYVVLDDSGMVEGDVGTDLPNVNLSQVGYLPAQTKMATFRGESIGSEFDVVDLDTGESVFTGQIKGTGYNASTDENCGVGDFSSFTKEGSYKIVAAESGESFEFVIGTDVYDALLDDTLRMMYLQRCGCELPADLAGEFAHATCHTQETVVYGTSTVKDVTGGWHDAGDYGRYVVSGAKTVADLLMAYEAYPEAFDDALNIPESGNGIPDILDEVKYELDWMFKMQESNGGVYHKVTCKNFPGSVFPEEETDRLEISPISYAATADFAAVMAMAARSYKEIDAAYADKCLAAAEKAMAYLEANPGMGGFKNPSDVVTGEYPDENLTDEYFWAAAELYRTTSADSYAAALNSVDTSKLALGLGWEGVGYYGVYTVLSTPHADATLKNKMQGIMDQCITELENNRNADAYGSTFASVYPWGSNMTIANNGMLYLMADNREGAESQLAYLLGNNANSYCFVTGYGTVSPISTHHRPSQASGKTMTGMLVGGPNSNLEDPYAQAVLKNTAPAKCYVDNEQSYSCNEVTVYWNSPLVYLLAGIIEE